MDFQRKICVLHWIVEVRSIFNLFSVIVKSLSFKALCDTVLVSVVSCIICACVARISSHA